MTLVSPRYQSLADQVSGRIAEEIKKGTWVKLLPGERALVDHLSVSRKTLRKALRQLRKEGLLATKHGIGHQIILKSRPTPHQIASVGLLVPESIENLRHSTALWVDELRMLLFENNIRLVIFSGHRFFSDHPENAIARLARQNPQACWVVSHSNKAIQRSFYSQGLPCIIAGSCHFGLSLPNVHMDYHATCRHAVGAMLSRGHRRIAYLTRRTKNAGDMEGEAGFSGGVSLTTRPGVQGSIMRHDGSIAGITRELARAFNTNSPPTAMLVNNPADYLTTASYLSDRGYRIGRDVSLISSDDDLFLSYLIPQPARYVYNLKSFAKELCSLILLWSRGEHIARRARRVETQFSPGDSLAAAPSRD